MEHPLSFTGIYHSRSPGLSKTSDVRRLFSRASIEDADYLKLARFLLQGGFMPIADSPKVPSPQTSNPEPDSAHLSQLPDAFPTTDKHRPRLTTPGIQPWTVLLRHSRLQQPRLILPPSRAWMRPPWRKSGLPS